jgi:hypothetical protein
VTDSQQAIIDGINAQASEQGHTWRAATGGAFLAAVSLLRHDDPRLLGAGEGAEELRIPLISLTAAGVSVRPVRGDTLTRDDGVTYKVASVPQYPAAAPIVVFLISRTSPMP